MFYIIHIIPINDMYLPVKIIISYINNIEVLGYNQKTKTFNGGYIPDILDNDNDMEHTLYVNAWDPWSLIGNGNERDNSLDGYWGRCSNMAILGWSLTNPFIKYRSV